MKTTIVMAALALAVAAPAFAAGDMTVDEKYAKYDTNKDGFLNQSEFDAKMAAHDKAEKSDEKFADIDSNSDGKISKAEMTAWKDAKEDTM